MDWRGTGVALGAGVAGATLATFAGLPAAALLGSTLAVTATALLKFRPVVPDVIRNAGFSIIGVTLGSGVTPEILDNISHWPLSLLMLGVTVIVIMLSLSTLLRTRYGADGQSALLATSPGALSYTLAIATDRQADVRFIMVLQSFRLLLITLFLPPLVGFAGEESDYWTDHSRHYVTYLQGFVLIGLAWGLGTVMERVRMPAATLLSGLLVSGTAHVLGLVSGRPPDALTFLGFTIAGGVIGMRFGGISRAELRRLGAAGTISTCLAVAISAASSYLVSVMLDLPFGQVWVSFAPGGVEGMSSMALALGYDPVYVATHHVFRILFLILILPLMLRLFGGKSKVGKSPPE